MSENHFSLRETQQIGEQTKERLIGSVQLPLLAQHGLGLVGHSDAQAGFCFVRRRPAFAQVLTTLSGSGVVRVGDAWRELKPGMVYLMPAYTLSAYHASPQGGWSLV